MRKTARDRYVESRAKAQQKRTTEIRDFDDLIALMLGGPAIPTQKRFIYAPDFACAYMGAAGGAKTTAGVVKVLFRLLTLPGSKGVIARANYNDLLDTTMKSAEKVLARLPPGILVDRDKSSPQKWWLKPIFDGDLSELTFMGLTDNLGSYEFDVGFIDEADEVESGRVDELRSRMRNQPYPGFDKFSVNLAFNPPPVTHWLYTDCTGMNEQQVKVKEPTLTLFKSTPRENEKNLPPGYYDRLSTLPPIMYRRLVEGEWGASFAGTPVYAPEFNYAVHVREKSQYTPGDVVVRMWDFGMRRPACVFCSMDHRGRLKVHQSVLGNNELADVFIKRMLMLHTMNFASAPNVMDFGDPAAAQQKDTGSTLQVLHEAGIQLRFMRSKIGDGVDATKRLLTQLIEGKPAVEFDRAGCNILIDGMNGGYAKDANGKPIKDGFYEHVMDAFRYGVINLYGVRGSHRQAQGLARAMSGDGGIVGGDSVEYRREYDEGAST
jgi:phage terminase large subunit